MRAELIFPPIMLSYFLILIVKLLGIIIELRPTFNVSLFARVHVLCIYIIPDKYIYIYTQHIFFLLDF